MYRCAITPPRVTRTGTYGTGKAPYRGCKTMIVSRSRTVHPQLTPFTLDETVLIESADLVILGIKFDAKMTFEKHLRSVSSAEAHRLGIMRKFWQVFHDLSLLLRSFWSFVLPVLEYC